MSRLRHDRPWVRLTLAATVTCLVAAGTAAPAAAGTARTPDGAAPPGAIDRPGLQQALGALPGPEVTAAQVRVAGPGSRFEGRGGVRDLVTGRPVPQDGRYRIASGTKMFTAVLVLRLAGQGRLDLSAPVQQYLPRLLPESYPPIPVGTLLDHTSGLPHSTEDAGHEDPAYFVRHRFDHYSPREVVASAAEHDMAFAPGTRQEYNGVNYFIAGLLVEEVTGHPYRRELRRQVIDPLRLSHTTLPGRHDVAVPGPHAHGYLRVDGVPVDVTAQSSYGWAESGIISTTADQRRFLTALLAGRLLPRAEQRLLFRVPDVPYVGDDCQRGPSAGRACYSSGLTRTELPGGVVVWGKSGSVAGTTTGVFATRDRDRLLAYALHPTGNRDGADGQLIQQLVVAAFGLGG